MTASVEVKITKPTTSWVTAGFTLVVIGWGANQFSPLLIAYESYAGVDATAANGLFALYAVALVPGLFIGGPLSDRFGRRTIALIGLVLSLAAGSVLTAGAAQAPLLYPGRLFAGLASGVGFSCGTAWVQELSAGERSAHGPRRAATAMTIGFAGGPLVAGILAQLSPAPLMVAYAPHLIITMIAIIVVARAGGSRPAPAIAATSQQSGRPDGRFVRLLILLAPWVFITASIGLAILPGTVRGSVGGYPILFAALVVALGALCGVFVQPLIARLAHRTRIARAVAYALGIAGLGVGALAVTRSSVVLVIIACAFTGAGYGSLLVVGLGTVRKIAPAHRLGRTVAIFQAATYVGYTSPFFVSLAVQDFRLDRILIILAVAAAVSLALTELLEPRVTEAGSLPDDHQPSSRSRASSIPKW